MKKRVIALILLLSLASVVLTACNEKSVSITYIYRNGRDAYTTVCSDENFEKPSDPTRDGYVFLGWSTDPDGLGFFDFSELPDESIALYAVWMPDYEKLSERVSTEAMKYNVKINSEHYTSPISPSATSQGSGAIFYETESHYYILTNHHVAAKEGLYIHSEYSVWDCYGNKYSAELLASDVTYDLAVMRIRKYLSVELSSVKLELGIPDRYETVVSLGSPKGQLNSVTVGEVSNYKAMENSAVDGSAVEFELIWHTAYANHGSSGGALINTSLDLIGINFAVATNENGEYLYCVSVPSAKIAEFLDANGYSYSEAD
jgi:uncharacterized repeat protein (TIGR02543 family)